MIILIIILIIIIIILLKLRSIPVECWTGWPQHFPSLLGGGGGGGGGGGRGEKEERGRGAKTDSNLMGNGYNLGWVNMYKISRFFYIFIIRQAHLRLKVPKQENFRRSLPKSRAEIELWANFLAHCCDKTIF